MKALTTSSSKALFDGLGSSSSPRIVSAFQCSDRLEFSSSNDKVGNFRVLQMVQIKGIHPVHALPSESQVELETEELQEQQYGIDSEEETKAVRIKFLLQKDCRFGEQFLVVGDDPMMGAWDPSNALPMTWSEGHRWFVEMDVPVGKSIQYKFILKPMSGDVIWQPGSDRIVKTWETINRITVCEDWENADLQKIMEEEESDYSNGKPLVGSEMSKFSEEEETVSDATDSLDFEEDIKTTHQEEKPMQQITDDITSSSMENPMAIVAENMDSSEDSPKNTPRRRGVNNMALQSEVTVHDLENMGKASQVNNHQEKEVMKDNQVEFEATPVLVPGLNPPTTEETSNDKVEERVTMDTSVEEHETRDENMPEVEFKEEQEESDDGFQVNEEDQEESEDGKPQEIAETLIEEPELVVDNEFAEKFHPTTALVKVPEVHADHENVLESDIQWGRGILKKLLSKFGLVRKILQ